MIPCFIDILVKYIVLLYLPLITTAQLE